MTLTRGTLPCTPHMEVPPAGFQIARKMMKNRMVAVKVNVLRNEFEAKTEK